MNQGLFSALYVLLFYVIFMESWELSLLTWKMNIIMPNAQHLMMFILQMSKQSLRELNNFPKISQQLGGRAGPWTCLCNSWAHVVFTTVQTHHLNNYR